MRNKRVRRAAEFAGTAGAAGVVVTSLLVVADVVMRAAFSAPITGATDVVIYTFAVVVASFFPVGLACGHNVTIRFLGKALGSRWHPWIELFAASVTMIIVVLLAWETSAFTLDATRSRLTTLTVGLPQAPWWWMVSAVFIACVPVQAVILFEAAQDAISGAGGAPRQSGHRE